jgi:hypothetical protein
MVKPTVTHMPSYAVRVRLARAQTIQNNAPLESTIPAVSGQRMPPGIPDQLHLQSRNVFRHLSDLKIPKVAYVAGAGPTLLKDIKEIPADAYVIACNRAILADYPFSAWMVFDLNAVRFPWFKRERIGSYKKIFGYRLAKEYPCDYLFSSRHVDTMRQITPGGLQGGGTIVSCAMQLLYWAGCQTVILLAAPMSGRLHFDRTVACNRTGPWRQATCMRYHCEQMRMGGLAIFSSCDNAYGVSLLSERLDYAPS